MKAKKKPTPRPNKELRNLKSLKSLKSLKKLKKKKKIWQKGKNNKKIVLKLYGQIPSQKKKRLARVTINKSQNLVRSAIITVIKKVTMSINILS